VNRGKEKGKAYERKVANHLSAVFDLSFTRTPNSGAYVGGANAFRLKSLSDSQILLTEGDIIVPDELRNLKIECKSRKKFLFHKLFTDNKDMNDWIEQSKSDLPDKVWFLLIKVNNYGEYVCFDQKLFETFEFDNFMVYNNTVVVSYTGFFEANKDILLDIC
tara:strand:- start:609 stop:1094 length:486 start_codon:yes stop_codon:yes gene_type:complete